MLKKQAVEKLLGRSLTSIEDSNFDQYIKNTVMHLENLLCWSPVCDTSKRTYKSRRGYRTLWVEPFTKINSITVDGDTVSDYEPAFNGSYNNHFYNSIEFDYPLEGRKVVVDAVWGFREFPADLGELVAGLFLLNGKHRTESVRSKSIEDYSVTYNDMSGYDVTVVDNQQTIERYRVCGGEIQNGDVHGRIYPF